jgi:hypothetical protein
VPAGLTPGTYDLVATNPGVAVTGTLVGAFRVLAKDTDDLSAEPADLWTSPATIFDGQTVELGLNVHRTGGNAALDDVSVAFSVEVPGQESIQLGTVSAGSVPPGPASATTVTTTWDCSGITGPAYLVAVIDPSNQVTETNESNNTVRRLITVGAAQRKHEPPHAPRLVVADGAQSTTSPRLSIAMDTSVMSATVKAAYFVERTYNSAAREWVTVQETGWLPIAATYTLTLTEQGGLHYLQAWVTDNEGRISLPSTRARINYLPEQDEVYKGQVHIYRYALEAGQHLTATLTSLQGDADLYVWDKAGHLLDSSDRGGTQNDDIAITAAASGDYQIEVRGYEDAEYHLDVQMSEPVTGRATQSTTTLLTDPTKSLPDAPAVLPDNQPLAAQSIPASEYALQWQNVYLSFAMTIVASDPTPGAKLYVPWLMQLGQSTQ